MAACGGSGSRATTSASPILEASQDCASYCSFPGRRYLLYTVYDSGRAIVVSLTPDNKKLAISGKFFKGKRLRMVLG